MMGGDGYEPIYICDGFDECCNERVCYQNGGPCWCTIHADHGTMAIEGAGVRLDSDGKPLVAAYLKEVG